MDSLSCEWHSILQKKRRGYPPPTSLIPVPRRPVDPCVDALSIRTRLMLDLDHDRSTRCLFDRGLTWLVFEVYTAIAKEVPQAIGSALGLVVEGDWDCLIAEGAEGFEFIGVNVVHRFREGDLKLNEG